MVSSACLAASEVTLEVLGTHGALMAAEQPTLDQ
jgi:hypothetical protein